MVGKRGKETVPKIAALHHAGRVLAILRESEGTADATASSEIAVSWRRCLLNHQLDPERADPPTVLSGIEIASRA
jgi:transcriptional regulator of acetoin/glycerol metabolism